MIRVFILIIYMLVSTSVCFAVRRPQEVNSINISNIALENDRIDANRIMTYYGWNHGKDSLVWQKDNGDEIKINVAINGRVIDSVELLTRESGSMRERFVTLQYVPANEQQKEPVPGHNKTPKEMFACRWKRAAVFQQGDKTLIIFFRSTRQGDTRFGPEQKTETRY